MTTSPFSLNDTTVIAHPDADVDLTKAVPVVMLHIANYAISLGIELYDVRMNIVNPAAVITYVRDHPEETGVKPQ